MGAVQGLYKLLNLPPPLSSISATWLWFDSWRQRTICLKSSMLRLLMMSSRTSFLLWLVGSEEIVSRCLPLMTCAENSLTRRSLQSKRSTKLSWFVSRTEISLSVNGQSPPYSELCSTEPIRCYVSSLIITEKFIGFKELKYHRDTRTCASTRPS